MAAPPPYTELEPLPALPAEDAPPYSELPPHQQEEEEEEPPSAVRILARFPASFGAYLQKSLSVRHLHLGGCRNRPLYTVLTRLPNHGDGIILYDGPSTTAPELARTTVENPYWGMTNTMTIPARDQEVDAVMGHAAGSPRETTAIKLEPTERMFAELTFRFAVEVGRGKDSRPGEFEWRHTRGNELKELDASSSGWKLVRMAGAEAATAGGSRDTRPAGSSSDGREIVAVFASAKGWSPSRAFRFAFLGSALSRSMGERFEIAAVVSALRIWYLNHQSTTAPNNTQSRDASG